MMRAWAVMLPLILAPAAAQAQADGPPVVYRVQQGDTLYGLAAKYLTRRADGEEVGRVNLVPNPRRLPIGSNLSIPSNLLRIEPLVAHLVAFSGPIEVKGPAGGGAPAVGMELREGFELSTGANAFLTFELSDGSRTTLPSQSRMLIERMRKVIMTGAEIRDLRLLDGRVNTSVTPMSEARSRFRILTPIAVSAVRGTEFRARHDGANQRSTVEVLEGRVAESGSSPGAEALVETGFGASVTPEAVSAPVALLPAPKLARRGELQDEPKVTFALEPLPGAAGYRAQIARDAGFLDLIAETAAATPEIQFDDVPNGAYFVRLTATDAGGLEGKPSTHAFERRLNALGLQAPGPIPGAKRQYAFKWTSTGGASETFRFILTRTPDGEPVIDAPGLSDRQITVTGLPPGLYYWRVGIVRREDGRTFEKWTKAQTFEIDR